MLDHILQCALDFEREHGTAPDVVYINPFHYDGLRRYHPNLFNPAKPVKLGFRLVIVPSNQLSHPEAALLSGPGTYSRVA